MVSSEISWTVAIGATFGIALFDAVAAANTFCLANTSFISGVSLTIFSPH
jgi:hypothetical protein